MAEYGNTSVQTVNPGEGFIFTVTTLQSTNNLIRHSDGTESFLLSGGNSGYYFYNNCNCCCNNNLNKNSFLCNIGCNIAIPTGGTVEEISIGLAIDGATVPGTIMRVTPAAVEEYFNVSRSKEVGIWRNCCQSISVKNLSTQPILVDGSLNLIITPPRNILY